MLPQRLGVYYVAPIIETDDLLFIGDRVIIKTYFVGTSKYILRMRAPLR